MIGKQIKGKSFVGTLNYVLGKSEAEIVSTNMLGRDVDTLKKEFQLSRTLRPNLKKCVYHSSLSLPKGERLPKHEWDQVTKTYLTKMDFKGAQYVSVIHEDTDHQHLHIVASRVRLDGSVVSDSQDYQRSEKAIRAIEKQFGLTRVASSRDVGRKAPTAGELRKALRLGKPSIKMELQGLIDGMTVDKPSMSEFVSRMNVCGVEVQANIAKTNHISGISFILDGEKMKGSDLGRKYTWQGLQRQGISYEPIRDFKEIREKSYRGSNEKPGASSVTSGRDAEERRRLKRLFDLSLSQPKSDNGRSSNSFEQLAKVDREVRDLLRGYSTKPRDITKTLFGIDARKEFFPWKDDNGADSSILHSDSSDLLRDGLPPKSEESRRVGSKSGGLELFQARSSSVSQSKDKGRDSKSNGRTQRDIEKFSFSPESSMARQRESEKRLAAEQDAIERVEKNKRRKEEKGRSLDDDFDLDIDF